MFENSGGHAPLPPLPTLMYKHILQAEKFRNVQLASAQIPPLSERISSNTSPLSECISSDTSSLRAHQLRYLLSPSAQLRYLLSPSASAQIPPLSEPQPGLLKIGVGNLPSANLTVYCYCYKYRHFYRCYYRYYYYHYNYHHYYYHSSSSPPFPSPYHHHHHHYYRISSFFKLMRKNKIFDQWKLKPIHYKKYKVVS